MKIGALDDIVFENNAIVGFESHHRFPHIQGFPRIPIQMGL
jgi:hypothetical protein